MNLEKWLQDKQGQIFRYKMEKIRYALTLLGNPERDIPVIHVAGTNGKGSTIAFMEELFEAHKIVVGTFVSPHMVSVHDRICVKGQPIGEADFQRLLQVIYELESLVAELYEPFRYFEVMVLMMFLYFREQKPTVALIEVGIGGLLDTTNVVDPVVSVITSVGLDHQDLLGSSLEEIAEQKAGIIKHSRPLVLGPVSSDTVAICQDIALEKKAPIYLAGRDYRYGPTRFANAYLTIDCLELGLVGDHQIENASVALQAFLLYMEQEGLEVSPSLIQKALKKTSWPGRLEKVSEQPTIYVDGAHNVPAIERLIEFIKIQDKPVTILFSALLRKDFQEMLELLSSELPQVPIVLTRFSYDGALDKDFKIARTSYREDYQQFIKDWKEEEEGILVITGSLYFISEVRQLFVKNELK